MDKKMEMELEYWKELENRIYCIREVKHLELLDELVGEIKDNNLSLNELIEILRQIEAEIVTDILTTLRNNKVYSEEEIDSVDEALKNIYQEEYIRDKQDGTLRKRIDLKKNKNARPISRHEILSIFFKNSLNTKLLWGMERTDDEFLQGLVDDFKELRAIRRVNESFRRQTESMEKVLTQMITDVKNLRKELE